MSKKDDIIDDSTLDILKLELENANKEIDDVEQERDELFVKLEKSKELLRRCRGPIGELNDEYQSGYSGLLNDLITFLDGE